MKTSTAAVGSMDFFDLLFLLSLIFISSVFFGMGYFVQKDRYQNCTYSLNTEKSYRTQLVINIPESAPKIEKEPLPIRKNPVGPSFKKPLDLTEKPAPVQAQQETAVEKSSDKPVRRIYGLKRVFSQGLGSTGSLSDAVIGKLGNTLDKEVDTISASEEEIKGTVVSIASITQAPKFKKTVKPLYSKIMLENQVEGVVKLKVLVDIDGRIKKATVLTDIGFDSAQQAMLATKDMEFYPAMVSDQVVAAWIIIPVRFVILS